MNLLLFVVEVNDSFIEMALKIHKTIFMSCPSVSKLLLHCDSEYLCLFAIQY